MVGGRYTAASIARMLERGQISREQAAVAERILQRMNGGEGESFRRQIDELGGEFALYPRLRACAVEQLLRNLEQGADPGTAMRNAVADAKSLAGYTLSEHAAEIPGATVHGVKKGVNNIVSAVESAANFIGSLRLDLENGGKLNPEQYRELQQRINAGEIHEDDIGPLMPLIVTDPDAPKLHFPRTEPGEEPKTLTGKGVSKGAEEGIELGADTLIFAGLSKVAKGLGITLKKITGQAGVAVGKPDPIRQRILKKAKAVDIRDLAKTGNKPIWGKDYPLKELLKNAEDYYLRHYSPTIDRVTGRAKLYSVTTEMGQVAFKGKSDWKKLRTDYTHEKMRLIPYIDDLLKTAKFIKIQPSNHIKHHLQGIEYYRFENTVILDGKKYQVSFLVQKSQNGKLFYEFREYSQFALETGKAKRNMGGGLSIYAIQNTKEKDINLQLIPLD